MKSIHSRLYQDRIRPTCLPQFGPTGTLNPFDTPYQSWSIKPFRNLSFLFFPTTCPPNNVDLLVSMWSRSGISVIYLKKFPGVFSKVLRISDMGFFRGIEEAVWGVFGKFLEGNSLSNQFLKTCTRLSKPISNIFLGG